MKYAIHEDFFESVEKKLNRVANKCKKHGNDFVFEVVGEEMREDKKNKCFNKFIVIEVEGTAKVNDWEFIASLDIHSSGNVIRKCNTDIDVPAHFLNSENVCEHCGTSRKRNNLYVIHNTVTDEFKQVGGNCLALYTHGLDIEYVAAYMDGITELCSNNGVFYGGGKRYYSIEDVLFYATVITRKIGYMKSNDWGVSTKGLVADMLRNDVYANTLGKRVELVNNDLKNNKYTTMFSIADFRGDCGSFEEVDNIIEYYKSCNDNSDFVHNVKIMLEEGYVPYEYLGYMCYLPCGYFNHIKREIEKAKRETEKHEHWGEVGKRYKNVKIKSVRLGAKFETVYGLMKVWNIVIDDDTVITWKTCNDIEDGYDTITFTVKAHGEYKDVKQTEVTRCKVVYSNSNAA